MMSSAKLSSAVGITVLFCLMLLHCHATDYFVGDADLGWSGLVSMESWPEGKHLYAGDVLIFNYDPSDGTNVVVVDKKGHDDCEATPGAKFYNSGNDRIALQFGPNYFISTNGLCPMGLKMAINATDYIVGDDLGWSADASMEGWPEGKHLYAGDVLIFKYDTSDGTNVVVVDQKGHDECAETPGSKVYDSGNDRIPLHFGPSYFINSANELCPQGMKMAINATTRPPLI
ncbi:hypothetical protein Tsubulata_021260 [Turnera subulata]|uniref:Phytocyanin domain-containing protein n=1 Tax=Turnera subulata TaxID=218843 RepID=A0A9Q0FAG7_9ROSI|nr:hypothetical protein Tsubulata_021260 [Turnera subulata]